MPRRFVTAPLCCESCRCGSVSSKHAITPRDVNGNAIEPFIIDGTTYLPVRGISSALGLGVDWDQNTHTVKLSTTGTQPSAQTTSGFDGNRVKVIEGNDSYNNGYLRYFFIVENSSSNTAFDSPVVTCTAYDSAGYVLATDSCHVNTLQPGEKRADFGFMSTNGEKPARVEMTISSGKAIAPSDTGIQSTDFVFSGTKERYDSTWGTTITGMIRNTSKYDAKNVKLIFLFRKDGKLIYGDSTYFFGSSTDIQAGANTPFEWTVGNVPAHDSFEVWATSMDL